MIKVIESLKKNLSSVIKGKGEAVELIVVALCSNGNVLMEDVPGVGKTTLAKTLALSIEGEFHRVQFTPDLLPSDILGTSIFNPKDSVFHFRKGPVFSNVLLADEINRASPRTQSALLEAMNESQATIEGTTYPLPAPFLVIATQNPIEYHGTYPLPEAQLDRFAMRIELGYPDEESELDILFSRQHDDPILNLSPVATLSDVLSIQSEVKKVTIERSVAHYMARLARSTRANPRIALGASPRALLTLSRCSQAQALVEGRDFVLPDDVKKLAVPVLAHRIVLDNKTKYSGVDPKEVIQEVVDQQKVPT